MTLYQGYTYEMEIPSTEALQQDALRLGAELRELMGYDAAVEFALENSGSLHEMTSRIAGKISEMKTCKHMFIRPVVGGMIFTNGDVDDDIQELPGYCPLCGMLEPVQEMIDNEEELPI